MKCLQQRAAGFGLPTVRVVVALVAGLVSSAAAAAEPLLLQPPGMVSYTYREPFKTDIPGTLDAIRKLGVRDIEFSNLFGATAAVIRRLLDEQGMTCSSYGVGYEPLIKSPDAVAADAKTLGARFVRVAWIPHQAPFTADHARARPPTSIASVGCSASGTVWHSATTTMATSLRRTAAGHSSTCSPLRPIPPT